MKDGVRVPTTVETTGPGQGGGAHGHGGAERRRRRPPRSSDETLPYRDGQWAVAACQQDEEEQ